MSVSKDKSVTHGKKEVAGETRDAEAEAILSDEHGFFRLPSAAEDAMSLSLPGDGGPVTSIHDPRQVLLFRHFMEGLVRIAMARYPYMDSLENQVERLFKEAIIPTLVEQQEQEKTWNDDHPKPLDMAKQSAPVFGFLKVPQIMKVFTEHNEPLHGLFMGLSTGEGLYGVGNAHRRRGRRGFVAQNRRSTINARKDLTVRYKDFFQLLQQAGLLETGVTCTNKVFEPLFEEEEAAVVEGLAAMLQDGGGSAGGTRPGSAAEGSLAGTLDGAEGGRGGAKRGKFSKMRASVDGRAFDDLTAMIADAMGEEDDKDEKKEEGGLDAFNSAKLAKMNKKMTANEMIAALAAEEAQAVEAGANQAAGAGGNGAADEDDGPTNPPLDMPEEERALLVFSKAADIVEFDWVFQFEEVLNVLLKPFSAATLQQLCWASNPSVTPKFAAKAAQGSGSSSASESGAVRGGDSPLDTTNYPSDFVGLGEFLELEMTYLEFQMALLQLCTLKTYSAEVKQDRLKLTRDLKLGAFIERVLLPAVLDEAYEPPSAMRTRLRQEIADAAKAAQGEADEGEEGAEGGEDAEAAAAKAAEEEAAAKKAEEEAAAAKAAELDETADLDDFDFDDNKSTVSSVISRKQKDEDVEEAEVLTDGKLWSGLNDRTMADAKLMVTERVVPRCIPDDYVASVRAMR